MESNLLICEQFTIVGQLTQIENSSPESTRQAISAAWGNFFTNNLLTKIPNQVNPGVIYGIYTNYKSDFHGPYDLIIGSPATAVDQVPADLISLTVRTSKYKIYTAKGPMPMALAQTWNDIWNSGLKRAYQVDFEVYDHRYQQPTPEVDVYISIP